MFTKPLATRRNESEKGANFRVVDDTARTTRCHIRAQGVTRQIDVPPLNFRVSRNGDTIYGNFTTAAETCGGHELPSRLGCSSAAIVLAED